MDDFLLVNPETFHITPFQQRQNPFLDKIQPVNKARAKRQHKALQEALPHSFVAQIGEPVHLPDIIFAANWALPLPRLPKPTVLLASMKYAQRQREQAVVKEILTQRDIICLPPLSTIFEGQAELKWFHGGLKAIQGYGFRSQRASVPAIHRRFQEIYGSYGLESPLVLPLKQIDPDLYHLDLCILEVDAGRCIVQKSAFSRGDLKKIGDFLKHENVLIIDSKDKFICNSIVLGDRILVNKPAIEDLETYRQIEAFTKKRIHVLDTSEFNKSGGGIRCMVLQMRTF